ncbi:MAG: DUF3168 domain-containing protein [Pseudomonadota bacterium]
MSDGRFLARSDQAVIGAVLTGLRADANLQAALGDPVRLYDGETDVPIYPYAVLERHESSAADTVTKRGLEHSLHFAAYVRHGGVEATKALLGVFRGAVEALMLDLPGQQIVFVLPTYCDVLRTKSPLVSRGLLRVRLYTEEV